MRDSTLKGFYGWSLVVAILVLGAMLLVIIFDLGVVSNDAIGAILLVLAMFGLPIVIALPFLICSVYTGIVIVQVIQKKVNDRPLVFVALFLPVMLLCGVVEYKIEGSQGPPGLSSLIIDRALIAIIVLYAAAVVVLCLRWFLRRSKPLALQQ